MSATQNQLQTLLTQIERRERIARMRALVYTLVPVVIAAVLLWVTFSRIRSAQQKVAAYEKQAVEAQKKTDELKEVLTSVEERLRQSTVFERHTRQLDWMDMKLLASRYPMQYKVLSDIRRMQDSVRWKLGGTSPDEGFDSPGFAAYILKKNRLLDFPISQRYHLRELLPPAAAPGIGDLIFYETGYTMFYFVDERERPFCVGMTPAGIVALDIYFGPPLLSYGRVRYTRR